MVDKRNSFKLNSFKLKAFKVKKIKPLVFLVISLFISAIAVTFAFFNSETAIANKFQTMTYDVTLEEEFYNKWGTKKVVIRNNDDKAAVILRVNYSEIWSKKDGDMVFTLSNQIEGEDVAIKNWSDVWDEFIDGGDGWYYYKRVLAPGSEVVLLESIAKNEELINSSPHKDDYENYDYELTFNYEAIQASEDAAKELWGKTVTIYDGNATWQW